jgi:hypothetical protein
MPDASSNHSHTTLVHSTAYRPPAIRGCPARTSTAKDGSSHTRWCTHVIGLTRQAVRPVRAKAAVQSPATTARRVRVTQTPRTSTATTAQTARSGSPRRARTPCSDWFET